MRVLITGANGFIGKNLHKILSERENIQIDCFTRSSTIDHLLELVQKADFIFHLAGVNRSKNSKEFILNNIDLTRALCDAIKVSGRTIPIVYTSSIQVIQENFYGMSKRAAENLLFKLHAEKGNPVYILRLPNVFGKWCKPNYNSVVATFCYSIARDLPIKINDPTRILKLVYIDDVIDHFLRIMDGLYSGVDDFGVIEPEYTITVGELADLLHVFKSSRLSLQSERVGVGITRALYSTYISYMPSTSFAYPLPLYKDSRGVFIEILKTPDCGQFSYFTAHPGITRGGHYHHSKTEKFLVVRGEALFRFRHILTNEEYELVVNGTAPTIVETIPGWAHDVTNIGSEEMIVMLWANEIFDTTRPDTYAYIL
jgi:UDP-2-acetamido-2,6-beta-L-arabino-hexul-4-ose reductase